jgi:uncharacterized repeat protein (TIGR01451 family)
MLVLLFALGAAVALAVGSASANTVTIGPGSMEGNVVAQPGDWVAVGWHFKFTGAHPAASVTFHGTTFSFAVTCDDKSKTPSQNPFVISVPDHTYSVAANDTNYIPWTNQASSSSFQAAVQMPALCGATGDTGMSLASGATFSSDVQSTDTSDAVQVQFHYRDPNAKGKGNINCSDPAQNPEPGLADVCGASVSATASVTPDAVSTTTTQQQPPPTTTVSTPPPPTTVSAATPHPAISVTKLPATQVVTSGATASFTIAVTNTGDVTLTNVNTTDALSPDCARTSAQIPALASLAPGQTVTYTCTSPAVTASFTNVVVATGTPPTGPNVSATASAAVVANKPLTPPKKKPKVVAHVKPKATG